MSSPELINLSSLIDDAKCFELVRQHRWPDGVRCPGCGGSTVVRNGHDDRQPDRQRYLCKDRHERFDDLSGTVLAGRKWGKSPGKQVPPRFWVGQKAVVHAPSPAGAGGRGSG